MLIGYVLLLLDNKEDVMSYTNQEKCAGMIDLLVIEPLRNLRRSGHSLLPQTITFGDVTVDFHTEFNQAK